MSATKAWTVHEVVGIGVVNPRAVNRMGLTSTILLRRPVYWTATVTASLEARKAGTGKAEIVFEIRDPGDTGREQHHRWSLGTCTQSGFVAAEGEDPVTELAGLEAHSYWWDFLDDAREAAAAHDVMGA